MSEFKETVNVLRKRLRELEQKEKLYDAVAQKLIDGKELVDQVMELRSENERFTKENELLSYRNISLSDEIKQKDYRIKSLLCHNEYGCEKGGWFPTEFHPIGFGLYRKVK